MHKGMEDFAHLFPITMRNRLTGGTEVYESPFDLWSDHEHCESIELSDSTFTDIQGEEIEFKTTV